MSRPNIIFLMTDQLRGDCLGYAGHPDVKTPYLDTLASTGTAFDRAYSACPSCIASIRSRNMSEIFFSHMAEKDWLWGRIITAV